MTDDLLQRLETKAAMIELGEKIAWGSETALIREAAARIRELESQLADVSFYQEKDIDQMQPLIRELGAQLAATVPQDSAWQPIASVTVKPGAPITMTYRNYRGEVADRTVIPRRIWWGATNWHPKPGWLMTAFDLEKNADRDFALADADFRRVAQPVAVLVKPLVWEKLGDNYMAFDPMFEVVAMAAKPAEYDSKRASRILSAIEAVPVADARDAALEEAANVVENQPEWKFGLVWSKGEIAAAIRELKGGAK